MMGNIVRVKLGVLSFCIGCVATLSGTISAQESNWKRHYDKAVVATFYSASALNGHDELEVANLYLDSARKAIAFDSTAVSEDLALITSLQQELDVSEDIASDNLNYIYPAFSVIKGDRKEFNVIDDPAELLIESLVERVIGIPDPVYRGLIKNNGHHVLVVMEPFNPVHLTVVLDFLSNQTPAYAIRPHEVSSILGESGWNRYISGGLDSAGYARLMNHFGVSDLVLIEVIDQGSIIPNPANPMLFYKGVRLWTVSENGEAKARQYFEDFRVDKAGNWTRSVRLVLLNVLLALVFLTLLAGVVFRNGRLRWNGAGVFQWESFKRNLIVLLVSGVVVVGLQWLGGAFQPESNAFRGEASSKLWLVYFILAPTVGASVLGYLALKRFADGLVDDMTNLARILYSAFIAHFIYLSFFTHYSELMPESVREYLALFPALFVLSPSFFLGRTLDQMLKKARLPWHQMVAFLIVLGLSWGALWLDFQHAFFWSYALYGIVFIVASAYLWILPALEVEPTEEAETSEDYNWYNPIQTVWKGTNRLSILSRLSDFIGKGGVAQDSSPIGFDIEPMLFVLSGEGGMGKSRLVNQLRDQDQVSMLDPGSMDIYYGDFNEQVDGQIDAYEPFVEAFSSALNLPKGFFADRSVVGRKLGKLVRQGADVLGNGLDIGSAFEVDDDGGQRSVEEMSEELVGKLAERANPGKGAPGRVQLIVIDHYNWAKDDPQTHDLMKVFLRRLLLQRKLQSLLRLVIVYDGKGEGSEPREVRELLDMAPGRSEFNTLVWDGSDVNDASGGRYAFFEALVNRSGFAVYSSAMSLRFERGIRRNLEHVCFNDAPPFNPGDVFAYLYALHEEGALKGTGDRVELDEEQMPEELNLAQGKLDELKRLFNALDPPDRKLLGMAANVGFKFDATILASMCARDLLGVLEQLAELEGQFVRDQAEEDNIYSFVNRELHRAIVKETSRGRKDQDFMQILVEYHKRTVASMLSLGDAYVQRLDLEILGSTADSCLKPSFLSVEAIRDTTPFVALHAALGALRTGRIKKAEEWVVGIVQAELPWWNGLREDRTSEAELMAAVLSGANDGPGLRGFDPIGDSGVRVLQAILEKTDRLREEANTETILLALYRDLFSQGPARSDQDKVRLSLAEWDARKEAIELRWGQLPRPTQPFRFAFYRLLMEPSEELVSRLEALLQEIKSTYKGHSLPLEGEVLRHLALKVKGDELKKKHAFAVEALQFEARRLRVTLPFVEETNPSWPEVMLMVKEMLGAKRPTSDFNFTLSRLRDVAYEEKEFDRVLELTDLAEEMSKSLSDKQGMILAKSYRGAAFFRKKDYQASLAVYREYSEFLMEEGRPKEDFRWPLEGILRNVEELDCPEVFLEEMKGLYTHLKFISQEMKEEPFASPISDKRVLGDLIPGVINSEPWVRTVNGEEQRGNAVAILEILSCIAMADDDFEEHEYHDLKESATALAVCLNLPDGLIREESKKVAMRVKAMKTGRMDLFKAALEKVAAGQDGRRFQRAVVQLCWDMAYADGVLDDREREYLDCAKAMLKS